MKLSTLIPPNQVVFLPPSPEVSLDIHMEILLDLLWEKSTLKNEGIPKEVLLKALIDRENAHPTAIGDGVAFPHARVLGLEGFYNLLAVSPNGLSFNSVDKKPVHVLLLSFVSRETPTILLQGRSSFVKFLIESGGSEKIAQMDSPKEVWSRLDQSEISMDAEITARYLMHPAISVINGSLLLRDAARELHLHHIDYLPVVDDNNMFLGELSCFDLMNIGLPDFFNQLHSVSFIKNMNPFEKYFQVDQSTKIDEVINFEADATISPESTLMEIVFKLAVKNRQNLYVVNESKRLIGVIDRFSIIDKILVANVTTVDTTTNYRKKEK